jgi:hypothetical protein
LRDGKLVTEEYRAFGCNQLADLHAIKNLPITVAFFPIMTVRWLNRRRSAVTHAVIVPSPSRTTPSSGIAGDRIGRR